jgi:hypothetical protein
LAFRATQEGIKPKNYKQKQNANFSKTHQQTPLGLRDFFLGRAGFYIEIYLLEA